MTMKSLRYWVPALVWGVVISVASTSAFTSAKTLHFIFPFLRWLLPDANRDTLLDIHHYIRKSAHVIEYALFTVLFMYGLRAGRKVWRWKWAITTLAAVACYAALDEYHQSFVPGRGASVWDVMLDTSGGLAALAVMWVVARGWGRETAREI